MNTITKERLEWLSNISGRDDIEDIGGDEIRELARIALASLEAEPVGTFRNGPCGYHPSFHEDAVPLFTVPPAPVVPEEMTMADAIMEIDAKDADRWTGRIGFQKGWNALRAAMLQGSQPVSNRDELPLNYLHGHKDGLEWAAQLAEANHPQTGDWLYDDPIDLARAIRKGPDMPTAQAANSPVTPDNSATMLLRWLAFGRGMQKAGSQLPRNLITETEAMLAAAPQQEVQGE